MGDITLSSAVRNNLLSLQDTAQLLGKTQERLSTGLKVNSALDDPSSFFTAAALNNRASDLNRLLDSVGLAVQTIQAADEGITALTDLVEAAQASARQALQSPAAVTASVNATVTGTGASVAADVAATTTGTVTTVAADTAATFTGSVTTIAADVTATGTGTVTTIAADAAAVATGTVTTIAADVAATSASSTGGNIDGTELLSAAELGTFANGDTLTIASSDSSFTSVSIAFDGGTGTTGATLGVGSATLANLITEINAQAGSTIASIVSGELSITSPTGDITVGGTNAAAGLSLTSSVVTNATLGAGAIDTEALTFTTAAGASTVTFGAANDTRAEVLATLNGGASGLTFAFTGNTLVATAPNTAAGSITTTGGTNALAAVGFTASQVDDVTNTTLDAITAGQTLTFTTAAGDSTVTFGTGSGQSNTQVELLAALNGGASGATFAITGNALVATGANAAAGDITVNASSGASALTGLGFTSGQVIGVTNTTLDAITSGQTLTFTTAAGSSTATFGTGSGQVNTQVELLAALNGGASGATFAVTGNALVATGANAAAGNITVDATSGASALTGLGFTSGQAAEVTNTTLDAITAGETLTFTTAAGDSTVTFGTGSGQSNTQTEVLAALNGGASGSTFAFTGNALVATGANVAAGDITVNASSGASALTGLGFTSGAVAETTNATLGAITQGQTLTIQIGVNTETVTFGSGSTEVNTAAELNTRLAAIQTSFGGTTAVSADTSGNLTVTAGNGTDSVTLGGTATLTTFGTNLNTTAIAPVAGATTNNSARQASEDQFNTLRSQLDQLASDASFNGNNLLQGDDLSAIFNSAGTSSLTITGVTFNSAGLGINAAAAGSFQSNTNIQTTLNELDTAISTLRTQASTFGSNLSVVETRQNFTNNLINVLETGAGNLTLADTNEEGANLLALQTRQQLSSVSLSLASQADQAVLRLF